MSDILFVLLFIFALLSTIDHLFMLVYCALTNVSVTVMPLKKFLFGYIVYYNLLVCVTGVWPVLAGAVRPVAQL